MGGGVSKFAMLDEDSTTSVREIFNIVQHDEYSPELSSELVRYIDNVLILQPEVGVNIVNPDNGKTPLIIAAEKNREEYVMLLVESGADINIKDHNGKTAFDYAVQNDNAAIASDIIFYENDKDKWLKSLSEEKEGLAKKILSECEKKNKVDLESLITEQDMSNTVVSPFFNLMINDHDGSKGGRG